MKKNISLLICMVFLIIFTVGIFAENAKSEKISNLNVDSGFDKMAAKSEVSAKASFHESIDWRSMWNYFSTSRRCR